MQAVITDGYSDTTIEDGVLSPAGIRVVSAAGRTEDEGLALIREADALLALGRPLSADLIGSLTRCRIISRYGTGVDSVDLGAARAHGIVVTAVPDASVEEVAAHSLALLLLCARKLWAFRSVKRYEIGDLDAVQPLTRPSEATLGLVGFGRIARALARISLGVFGRVRSFDPYVNDWDPTSLGVERAASLQDLLGDADLISLHLPLTADTERLIGSREIESMKQGAALVNTARGGLIDEEALLEALSSGKLSGAGLDVLQQEPPPTDHRLLALPQVFYTPHLAWYSETSRVALRRRAAEEVRRVLTGQPARNPVAGTGTGGP